MIRTRIAPSPTGYPHLALIYQAIFDYVLARKYNGKFVLRIEDTDRSRYVQGSEEVIYDSLSWSTLVPDESPEKGGEFGPYRQSERLSLYQKYASDLLEKGFAYRCFCTKERLDDMRKKQEAQKKAPQYDRMCAFLSQEEIEKKREEQSLFVIRMKIPDNRKLVVHDEIVGDVVFESGQIDDQVILKSDGFPTYHLAVVVDDYLMKITHVFRGTEWLPSFPKHLLLWEFFGWQDAMPKYIHVPILLNSEGGGKLSKRHAHTAITYYRSEGFLPEAIINYLANIVWNHPDGKEIFPLMDFGQALDVEHNIYQIKSNGVHFDLQKLLWINGEYMRMIEDAKLKELLISFYEKDSEMKEFFEKNKHILDTLIILAKTRMKILKEFRDMVLPANIVYSENEKIIAESLKNEFEKIADWGKDAILGAMKAVLKKHGVKGNVLYKIVTGREKGLPLPEYLEAIGKEATVKRISNATQKGYHL